MKRMLVVGLLVAVALAAVVSLFASSAPDGLQRVAAQQGFAEQAQESAAARSPLAGYAAGGNRALAGLIGVAVTGAVALGTFRLIRRRQS